MAQVGPEVRLCKASGGESVMILPRPTAWLRGGNASAALFAAVALLAVFVGCTKTPEGPRQWRACTCQYITDYDDQGDVQIELCSPHPPSLDHAAACARNQGVGAITRCRCQSHPNDQPCGFDDACRAPR